MADPTEALTTLRRLAATGELASFCTAHGVDLVVAFGSALQRDPAIPPRDLDVGLLLGDRAGADFFGAVSDLIGLVHSDALDVMDLARAGVLAGSEALGTGQLLYERRPGIFAEQQMRALGQRMENGWLFDLQLATLTK